MHVLLLKRVSQEFNTETSVEIPEEEYKDVQDAAMQWVDCITTTLRYQLADKDTVLRSSAVFSALGAYGHDRFHPKKNDPLKFTEQDLKAINWNNGDHWDGIAGSISAKTGKLSLGGSKEVAHRIFTALNDENSPTYSQIRKI